MKYLRVWWEERRGGAGYNFGWRVGEGQGGEERSEKGVRALLKGAGRGSRRELSEARVA